MGISMSIRWKLLILVLAIIVVMTGMAIVVSAWGNLRLIELQAQQIAKTVAIQVEIDRKHYTASVVEPLRNSEFAPVAEGGHEIGDDRIPLPAEFVRLVSDSVSKSNSDYRYRLVSRWNINSSTNLDDQFLITAFEDLLEQEAVAKTNGELSPSNSYTNWTPVWEITEREGRRILRYMGADPAASISCVTCHNMLEQREDVIARRTATGVDPRHQFSLNDLMGAIVVEVDLEEAATLTLANVRSMFSFAIATAVLVGLIAFLGSNTLVTPLEELSAASRALAEGGTIKRVTLKPGDELGDLGTAFNTMATQVESRTSDLKSLNEELESRNQELEVTLQEVKQLSGLLPICAKCKKIRDDDGYWRQVESYIGEHSKVEFSHGICPHCAEELYPDLPPE